MSKIKVLVITALMLLGATFLLSSASVETASAAPSACEANGDFFIDPLTSLDIGFDCDQATTVYFGACDSGGVPNDDLFNITLNGAIVSSNYYDSSGNEFVNIGSMDISAGSYVATLNSLNVGVGGATYSYSIAQSFDAVVSYLSSFCGEDFAGPQAIPTSACAKAVPVFIEGTAPAAGTVVVKAQFGEMNRSEGYTVGVFNLSKGDMVNNQTVFVEAPQYIRVWWQADGDDDWYLLPSQYWHGGGTTDSEYGVSCTGDGVPSYHTSYEDRIIADEVPMLKQ